MAQLRVMWHFLGEGVGETEMARLCVMQHFLKERVEMALGGLMRHFLGREREKQRRHGYV